MMALNFREEKHKKMLIARAKRCTVRLGDISAQFPENSIVWITTGEKGEQKQKLYTALLDKVRVKTTRTRKSPPGKTSLPISRRSTRGAFSWRIR